MRRGERGAIEAKPGSRIDQHPFTIDEIGDPQRPIPQEDRDLAPLALTQQLALNTECEWRFDVPIQCGALAFVLSLETGLPLPNPSIADEPFVIRCAVLLCWKGGGHLPSGRRRSRERTLLNR
jgi:hypothetical protein